MRATKRKREKKRVIAIPPNIDLDDVARNAIYVGSPEHKGYPSFAGPAHLRVDASECPPEINDQNMMTRWLRDSIRRGIVGKCREGKFPRYVWCKRGNTVYVGRITNRVMGQYKGYPLGRDEWPPGIEEIYGES